MCTCIKDDEYSTTQNLTRETIKGFSNPWAFKFGELCDAYEEVQKLGILDDIEPHTTSVYFALGKRLYFSRSSGYNFKITTKEDIDIFEGLLLLKAQREKNEKVERATQRRDKCMISYKEFEVINTLLKAKENVQDAVDYVYSHVRYYIFKSKEEISSLLEGLRRKNYVSGNSITRFGMEEIEPLRVRNAVILSAGGGKCFC